MHGTGFFQFFDLRCAKCPWPNAAIKLCYALLRPCNSCSGALCRPG